MLRHGVIFDFDGTLADTCVSILKAMRLAYAELGLGEPDDGRVTGAVGLSLPLVVRAGGAQLDGDSLAAAIASYRRHFALVSPHETRLFAGIREALVSLASAGVVLAVATSKTRAAVVPLLEEYEVIDLFGAVICDDDVQNKKPHPEMVERLMETLGLSPGTWMVGDTRFDIEMGLAAGIGACGVSWGNQPRAALAEAGAHLVLDTPGDLAALQEPWSGPAAPTTESI